MGADDAICKGGSGTILPFVHIENQTVGAILYLIALLWFFQGVSIIADIFMCAIEKITSAKQTVICIVDGQEQTKTMKVWNKTVANLTLMALGSSAPEILLSLIELLQLGMHSGDLGPSTIVGSAAFNLLVITAVCILHCQRGSTG
jgi:solute carrier family 8 (sodium/calcium exchanger)